MWSGESGRWSRAREAGWCRVVEDIEMLDAMGWSSDLARME